MRKLLAVSLLASLISVGCNKSSTPHDALRVGTIAGPETELMQVAAEEAGKNGVTVNVIEFSDYAIPNTALNEGSLDANMFQHAPYLENTIKQRHYAIVAVAKTFIYPMGIYSKKIKNLAEVSDGAIVAIPNDPTNEARSLLLLQKANLIHLKNGGDANSTPHDIDGNPKNLKIKEMDAAGLPRVLDDVTIAAINTNYAIPAGLLPSKDALFIEDKNSPYANLLVVREADKDSPKIKILIEALHSGAVKDKAEQLFQGQAIAAW